MNPNILVTVRREHASRFYKSLAVYKDMHTELVTEVRDAVDMLADRDKHIDVFVIDNNLDGVYDLVNDLRHTYPRLLIVLVDEEADFGMPGLADDITTAPFDNDDLKKRILRLMSDRRQETLRADSLPAVRTFAKALQKASGLGGKEQAAAEASKDLGYDYVAYYRLSVPDPIKLALTAQVGANAIKAVAPKEAQPDDLMMWVFQSGQSRIVSPSDQPNHLLVARGRLGAAACVPATFSGKKYGVLVAAREMPNSINQENVMMLELVSAQLAAAVSKEKI